MWANVNSKSNWVNVGYVTKNHITFVMAKCSLTIKPKWTVRKRHYFLFTFEFT